MLRLLAFKTPKTARSLEVQGPMHMFSSPPLVPCAGSAKVQEYFTIFSDRLSARYRCVLYSLSLISVRFRGGDVDDPGVTVLRTFAVRAQDDSHGPRRLRSGSNRVKCER